MSFKRVVYNKGECVVKIKIEDANGARLENWTVMLSDFGKVARTICRKYTVDEFDKSAKDLDWAI